jgi:hypothetical protein
MGYYFQFSNRCFIADFVRPLWVDRIDITRGHPSAGPHIFRKQRGTRKRWDVRAFSGPEPTVEEKMRTAVLAIIVVSGGTIAFQATAQEQKAAPSEQTKEEMHRDVDKGLKAGEPDEQMQRDAVKGIKTRNSGVSGYVADQDKPGASAHPPGQPGSEQTTGSSSKTGVPK